MESVKDEAPKAGQKNVILPEGGKAPSNLEQIEKVAKKHEVVRREVRNDGHIEVVCVDKQKNGAPHEYLISQSEGFLSFFLVNFQDGPIKFDEDVNGCQHEDLIAIVIDRLEHFQKADLSCKENAMALEHLRLAIEHLESRTTDRKERGVEVTLDK